MIFLRKIKEFIHTEYTCKNYEAVIIYNGKKITITNSENIFNTSPFIYGFYFDEFKIDFIKKQEVQLQYHKSNVLIASNIITFLYETNNLYLFNIKKTQISLLNSIKVFLFYYLNYCKKIGKMETTFSEQKTIASIYAIPRKVYLCSFTSLEGKNILFPIDLVIGDKNNDMVFYSIRKSNNVVKEIIKKKKVTLIYSQYCNKKSILKLGKYHSVTFPKLSTLGFKTKESQLFKHPIPEFSNNYIEIENLKTVDLESQILFIGRILFEKTSSKKHKELANIYFLFKNKKTRF